MDRQEQAGRQGAQLTQTDGLQAAKPGAESAGAWRRAAIAAVLLLTGLRLLYLAISPIELDFEEAQYWFWAQDPAWGYFSKPPLIAWLIAASTAVLGDGEFGVRAWSPLLHGATALVLGAIGQRIAGPRAGFWSALAYATLPGVSFSALLMTTDVPLAFAWSLALYAFLRLGERDGRAWAIFGGAAAGVGLLAKYTMLFFLPAALLALLLLPDWRRRIGPGRLWVFAGIALALILPNIFWNVGNGGVTLGHMIKLAAAGGAHARADTILAFAAGQLAIAGPLFVAMAAAVGAGTVAMRRPEGTADRTMLVFACFVLPLLAVYVPLALLTRANANWTAMAYVAATVAAVVFGLVPGRRFWIRPIVAAQLALAVAGPIVIIAAPHLGLGFADRLLDRVSGWREMGRALDAKLAQIPGTKVLFFDPTLAKRLIYYGRLEQDGFVMWNPEQVPHNELDRRASLAPDSAGRWLLVTAQPPAAAALAKSFADIGAPVELTATLPGGRTRRLVLQELAGFTGYQP